MKEPFWSEGVRFSCQQSGRCCVARGEYGFVYLTVKDEQALASHLGLDLNTFRQRHCEKTDGYWHLRDPQRDCHFLDGRRCGVYEARPLQCRTWPFWPETMGNVKAWQSEVVAWCPGAGRGQLRTAPEIQQTLDLHREGEDDPATG